jgi:hypothetical protein
MNATEAINKIVDLLGLKFKQENFASTKLIDGITEVTNNKDADLSVGDELFVMGDSTLSPAPFGTHETREGLLVTVDEGGKIVRIETKDGDRVEDAVEDIRDEREDMMSSDTLADGTKIETDESGKFEVGQQLYFITESGEKVKAPSGEHTTQSGITIVTDGEGIITGVKYPDESGEGSLEDFKSEMKKMKEAMAEMVSMMKEMNKFSEQFHSLKSDFQEFKKQPDRDPVLKKFNTGTSEILDAKLELLKASRGIK